MSENNNQGWEFNRDKGIRTLEPKETLAKGFEGRIEIKNGSRSQGDPTEGQPAADILGPKAPAPRFARGHNN